MITRLISLKAYEETFSNISDYVWRIKVIESDVKFPNKYISRVVTYMVTLGNPW